MDDIDKKIKIIQSLKEDIKEYESIHTDAAFRKVCRRMGKRPLAARLLNALGRAAAILAIPLLMGTSYCTYLYVQQLRQDKDAPMLETCSVAGQISRIVLSDGSVVWLNAESKLVYPARFDGKKRNVQLTGEGYFEVKADPEHPFFVSTPDGIKVMAHGTEFNVDAYPEEGKVKMTLVEGKVDICNEEGRRLMKLSPGFQVEYDKEKKTLSSLRVNLDAVTGWTEGKMIFRDATIADVVKRLSRHYNVDINLHCDAPDKYRFRATFSHESISQVLDYLRLAAPLSWSFSETRQQSDFSYPRQEIDLWLE